MLAAPIPTMHYISVICCILQPRSVAVVYVSHMRISKIHACVNCQGPGRSFESKSIARDDKYSALQPAGAHQSSPDATDARIMTLLTNVQPGCTCI
jgi:hypothetical protein